MFAVTFPPSPFGFRQCITSELEVQSDVCDCEAQLVPQQLPMQAVLQEPACNEPPHSNRKTARTIRIALVLLAHLECQESPSDCTHSLYACLCPCLFRNTQLSGSLSHCACLCSSLFAPETVHLCLGLSARLSLSLSPSLSPSCSLSESIFVCMPTYLGTLVRIPALKTENFSKKSVVLVNH